MRLGCINKTSRCIFSLFLLSVLLSLVLFVPTGNAYPDTLLEISISIVEDDTFGPGDSFHAIIEIRNREAQGRVDVVVSYSVLDSKGDAILSNSKTIAVETKSSFAEEFVLPSSIPEGTYYFHAVVTSLDGTKLSEASCSFNVMVVEEGEQRIIEYIMAIALVGTVIGLLFEHRRVSKMKVTGKDLGKFIEKKE